MKHFILLYLLTFVLSIATIFAIKAESIVHKCYSFVPFPINNLYFEALDSSKINESLIGTPKKSIDGMYSSSSFNNAINTKKYNKVFLKTKSPISMYENQYFDKLRKLEYYVASSDIRSNIISDTIGVSTTSNSVSNIALGLNFRLLNKNNTLGSMWTLRYQDYGFSVATDSIEKNPESLKIKQASLEFRARYREKEIFIP